MAQVAAGLMLPRDDILGFPVRRAVVALVTATILVLPLGGPAGAAGADLTGEEENCQLHPPIRVTEDRGPTGYAWLEHPATGEALHRPGSGVVAGDGTAEDPYVIRGWCITSPPRPSLPSFVDERPPPAAGIHLEQTRAHVVVEGNVLVGDDAESLGIVLKDAENVVVRDNEIRRHGTGVQVAESEDAALLGNRISGSDSAAIGIVVEGSKAIAVEANEVVDHGQAGVRVVAATAVTVAGNTVAGNAWGAYAGAAVDLTGGTGNVVAKNTIRQNDGHHNVQVKLGDSHVVRDNRIEANSNGIILWATDDALVQGNEIHANDGVGIGLPVGGSGHRVLDNEVTDNGGRGIDAWATRHNTIAGNTVAGNSDHGIVVRNWTVDQVLVGNTVTDNAGDGIVVKRTEGHRLEANTLTRNRRGLVVAEAEAIDVDGLTVRGSAAEGVLVDEGELHLRRGIVTGNGDDGVQISGGQATIIKSDVHANDGHGLSVADAEATVDARRNWWGHESGPSGDLVDACTDEVADGRGASIHAEGARICFDPWSSAPHATNG